MQYSPIFASLSFPKADRLSRPRSYLQRVSLILRIFLPFFLQQFATQPVERPRGTGNAVPESQSKQPDLRLRHDDHQNQEDQHKGHERFSRKEIEVLETVVFDAADHKQGEGDDTNHHRQVGKASLTSQILKKKDTPCHSR